MKKEEDELTGGTATAVPSDAHALPTFAGTGPVQDRGGRGRGRYLQASTDPFSVYIGAGFVAHGDQM